MSKTKTAETIHGSVEYESVECISCENEITKETAQKAAIGEYHGKDAWGHKPYDELKFGNYATGYVCEYCADDPVSWPTKKIGDVEMAFFLGFALSTVVWFVLLLLL